MPDKLKIKMKKIGDLDIKFPVVEVPMPGLYTEMAEGTIELKGQKTGYRIGVAVNMSALYYFVDKMSPIEIPNHSKKSRVFVIPLIAGEKGQEDGAIVQILQGIANLIEGGA